MKTSFTLAAIAATYLAMSVEGQNLPRFLQNDTCQAQDTATYQSFDGVRDGATTSESFFLKGRDGQALCTDANKIQMGLDNRAFVLTEADYSADKVFKPKYLGGTLKFDVDVSELGCNCAAGVFLVALDEEKCNWGKYEAPNKPQCPTVDVMKANTKGFQTASLPCESGSCDIANKCKSNQLDGVAYGAGSEYLINTLEPYTVETQFLADSASELVSIKTMLSQNNNTVPLELDCKFGSLGSKLDENMAMAISTYHLKSGDSWINDQCTDVCSSATTTISGVRWSEGDAIVPLVWGEAAPDLKSGDCLDVNCSECRESWYEDTPEVKQYRCKDEAVFAYRNKCFNSKLEQEGMNLCMTGEDQLCHWSFPADDPKKGDSERAACRTIPQDYIDGSDWKFRNKESEKITNGLCRYGCEEEEGTCHWSWPKGEKAKNNPKAMYRCKPKEDDL